MVSDGRTAGALALIWSDGREVYFGAAGFADREARWPGRRNTLFQIWSMTKPASSCAADRQHHRVGRPSLAHAR